MEPKILVAYASVSGSTAEVAQAIGDVLSLTGASVRVDHVKNIDEVSEYQAVILGSSIRVGRWLPEAILFLETHQEALSQKAVAYFTTCLTMAEDNEDSRRTVLSYLEPLLQRVPQVKPVGLGLFAGSLDPSRALIMPTLPGPQRDYRNWLAIRAWAEEIRPALLPEDSDTLAAGEPIILGEAVLHYTDMSGLNLSQADLHGAGLYEANLSEANLSEADLGQAHLNRANLRKADLRGTVLAWADMIWADLQEANLTGANLMGSNLSRANLHGANLAGANLNGTNLSRADLSGANLTGVDLHWADLNGADLSQADLGQANLGWANLSNAELDQTRLEGVRYNSQTQWPPDFAPQAQGAILVEGELH